MQEIGFEVVRAIRVEKTELDERYAYFLLTKPVRMAA